MVDVSYTQEQVYNFLVIYGSLKFMEGIEEGYPRRLNKKRKDILEMKNLAKIVYESILPKKIRNKIKKSDKLIDKIIEDNKNSKKSNLEKKGDFTNL